MPSVETMAFYACAYRRCPVKWWPVEAGSECPHCGKQGIYAGVAVKQSGVEQQHTSSALQPPEEESSDT
jgi:hypothetical protein